MTAHASLLDDWSLAPKDVLPWQSLSPERYQADFDAAFAEALCLREREIEAIVTNPNEPSFDNTIVALERAGRPLQRVQVMFGILDSTASSPVIEDLARVWRPRLAAASNAITFNPRLFARIDVVFRSRHDLALDAEQLRLIERMHAQFVRVGAALDGDAKARLAAINERLAVLFTEFDRRVMAEEATVVVVNDAADLDGLPDGMKRAFAAEAEARGHAGAWAIANTRSSVDPLLTLAANRDLRERVWRAFKSRGANGGETDTRALIKEILQLRAERAKLLGFASHAHFRMADEMAAVPARAELLMQKVWRPALARVREEVRDMQVLASDRGGESAAIAPWDYLYYAEQVRRLRYDFDERVLREYFPLSRMIDATFWMAEKLYGLSFREVTGAVPTHHPDVRVWEVRRRGADERLGLFYGDYFARAGKRSGAWQSTYRGHEHLGNAEVTPIVSNNCNFTRGADGEAVLLSLDDAVTLFHEFGHALHALLSDVKYPGLAGTSRDYVEYPSQLHENWLLTRPILDRFARHYQTGEPMPQDLVERVLNAATFNQGYATVEYLSCALLDMALHTRTDFSDFDAEVFERETLASIGMPAEIAMRHRLPHFSHLFSSDGYSAGYYSYLWSEVMDADTWELFERSGDVFDQKLAEGLRTLILAPGNSSDRAVAYRAFAGRDPSVDALLRARGFSDAA